MVDTKYFAYGSGALALIGAMGSFVGQGNPIISFISGLLCLVGAIGAVAIFKYGYIVIPLLTQRAKIVQIMEGGY